jgi:hypothetical protein
VFHTTPRAMFLTFGEPGELPHEPEIGPKRGKT